MSQTPIITVITICLNAEEIIEATIKSVIQQQCNRAEIEYIVVDGVSTDNTLKIINKYSDQIDVIISEKDKGIADAFNKGVKLAKGMYILTLNAGDNFMPNVLANVISKLKRNSFIDILYGNAICSLNNKPMFKLKAIPSSQFELIHPFMCHQAMFCKKSLFEQYGYFSTTLKFAMDYDWYLNIYLQKATIEPIDIDIVNYSLGGTSDQNIIRALKECQSVAIKHGFDKNRVNWFYFLKIQKAKIQNLANRIGIGHIIIKAKSLYKSKYGTI